VRLLDLQLLYGVAGAREHFERLCTLLIQSEYDSAKEVRCEPGDGGVDVYVGKWDDPEGIAVFQVKYFPTGLKESQKQQIRASFRTCINNPNFQTRKWTLCLPIELSEEETTWFTHWKQQQATSTLPSERITWWGESDLMQLLLKSGNEGIKEHYFQEQHLTQIREMHGMLSRLLDEISSRPPEAMGAFALRQDSKEANLRYKEEVYMPLHTELRTLLVAFENAHASTGPYPEWITVTGGQLPRNLRYAPLSSHGLVFHFWPATKNEFRVFGALTSSARQLLDDLVDRITAYNLTVEAAREAAIPLLTRHIAAGLERAVQDPAYQEWKATYKDAPTPPPDNSYQWFEQLWHNTAPEAGSFGALSMAKWWLGRAFQTLGWLLANRPDHAAERLYEDYERRGNMRQSESWESWFREVCQAAYSDLVHENTYRQVMDAQERLFLLVSQIESMLLNVLYEIQYRYEGGPPPL